MFSYRIIIADDHVMVRQGLKRIIQEDKELQVIGEVGDGLDLLDLLEETIPDMVLLDVSMPRLRGLEVIKIIKELYPKVKVLILTMHKSKEYLYQAMASGADGYLLKEDADQTLYSAIKAVRQGKPYISPLIFR
jgi:DNA-binding NarL/FixJ family response regulator